MKPRVIAILFIAVLVLLSVVWGRTAKAPEQPHSMQNPGYAPPVAAKKTGSPDMPICAPGDPPSCAYPNARRI